VAGSCEHGDEQSGSIKKKKKKKTTQGNISSLRKTLFHEIFSLLLATRNIKSTRRASFTLQSALRKGHSFFRSHFSTECDLVLPLSSHSILFFLKVVQ
jgi:hypothetical protein